MSHRLIEIISIFFFANLGLKLFRYGMAAAQIAAIRFTRSSFTLVDKSEENSLYQAAFSEADETMSSLGFNYSFSYSFKPAIVQDKTLHFGRIYKNNSDKTYAQLFVCEENQPDKAFSTNFITFIDSEKSLNTLNRILTISLSTHPNRKCEDMCCDNLPEQWQFHKTRIESLDKEAIVTYDLNQDFIDRLEKDHAKELESHELVENQEGEKQIPIKKAYSAGINILKGYQELSKNFAKCNFPEKLPTGYAEAELIRFNRLKTISNSVKTSFWHKLALMILSLGLSTIAFGLLFSWSFMPILIMVLFLHESGHMLAMIIFGYKKRQMLFLPPFGAVAMGEKPNAKSWQTLIVLLMGPIPGLILAIGIILVYPTKDSKLLTEAVGTLAFINFLNFLPIYPLDGGKIFELLFLTRFPKIKSIFSGISILPFAIAGIWLKDTFLIILALFFAWIFIKKIKATSLNKKKIVHSDNELESKIAPLHSIIFEILNTPLRKGLFMHRFQAIKHRLEVSTLKPPGWITFITGSAFYFSVLLGPFALAIIGNTISSKKSNRPAITRDWEKDLSAESSDEGKFYILLDAFDDFYYEHNIPESDKYRQRAIERASKMAPPEKWLTKAYCSFLESCYRDEDALNRLEFFEKGMKLSEDLPDPDRGIAVSKLTTNFFFSVNSPSDKQIKQLENAIGVCRKSLPQGHPARYELYGAFLYQLRNGKLYEKADSFIKSVTDEIPAKVDLDYAVYHKFAASYLGEQKRDLEAISLLTNFLKNSETNSKKSKDYLNLPLNGLSIGSVEDRMKIEERVRVLNDLGWFFGRTGNLSKAKIQFELSHLLASKVNTPVEEGKLSKSKEISLKLKIAPTKIQLAWINWKNGNPLSAIETIKEIKTTSDSNKSSLSDFIRRHFFFSKEQTNNINCFRQKQIYEMLEDLGFNG